MPLQSFYRNKAEITKFNSKINKWIKDTDENLNDLSMEVARLAFNFVRKRTPRWTGLAQHSWRLANRPDEYYPARIRIPFIMNYPLLPVSAFPLRRTGKYWIFNNQPYINYLEYEHPRGGMIAETKARTRYFFRLAALKRGYKPNVY